MGTGKQLASLFIVIAFLFFADTLAVDDLTRHLHRHHHPQQQQPIRTLAHGDVSRCDDVCRLRMSVERLSAVQRDYGRALHDVYGLVDTVRRDFAADRY